MSEEELSIEERILLTRTYRRWYRGWMGAGSLSKVWNVWHQPTMPLFWTRFLGIKTPRWTHTWLLIRSGTNQSESISEHCTLYWKTQDNQPVEGTECAYFTWPRMQCKARDKMSPPLNPSELACTWPTYCWLPSPVSRDAHGLLDRGDTELSAAVSCFHAWHYVYVYSMWSCGVTKKETALKR
jgi:hypothetical protein